MLALDGPVPPTVRLTPQTRTGRRYFRSQLHPARASQCRLRPKKGPQDQQRHQEKADSSQNQEGHKASSAHTKTAESTYSRPKPRGRLNAKPSACAETAPTTAFLARLGAPPVPSRTGFPEGNATHKEELRPKKRMSGNRFLFPSVPRKNQRKSSGIRKHVYALALNSYNRQRIAAAVEGRGTSPQTDMLQTTDASR